MKKILRSICVFMAIALTMAVPVSAEEVSTRSSSFIAAYSASICKASETQIEVWFEVIGTGMMDEIGAREIKIQRSASGTGNWITVRTFYGVNHSNMICDDTYAHYSYVTYNGTPGYYYRAIVTIYAKNDTGTGATYAYTKVLKL